MRLLVQEDKENNEVIFEFYGNGFLYNQGADHEGRNFCLRSAMVSDQFNDFCSLYEVKDRNECRNSTGKWTLSEEIILWDKIWLDFTIYWKL